MKITFCGNDIDEAGRPWQAVEEINVWYDPLDRSKGPKPRGKAKRLRGKRSPIMDKVTPGEHGVLLRRDGNYCKVRTARGKVGWVTFYFIKELKDKWLTERRAIRARQRLATPV